MTPVTCKNQLRCQCHGVNELRSEVKSLITRHGQQQLMAGGHGQDGQGQEIGGGGMTTTSGDGPDIFQIRKFVPQPNS